MLGAQALFAKRERAFIERAGLRVSAESMLPVRGKSIEQAACRLLSSFGQRRFDQGQRRSIKTPRPRPSLGIRNFIGIDRRERRDQTALRAFPRRAGCAVCRDLAHQAVQANCLSGDGRVAFIRDCLTLDQGEAAVFAAILSVPPL